MTTKEMDLRAEATLHYDAADDLVALVAAMLECAPEQLSSLHLKHGGELPLEPPLCPTLHHAFRHAGRKLPYTWTNVMGAQRNKKVIKRLHASCQYKAWLAGYDRFVRAVVLPSIGEDIYYQRPPTLRVAMPSHAATIGIHRDADYPLHHQAEINYWIPLTPVVGSSALWLESSPDQGDFAPRPLQVGDCLKFNGNQCRHHTVANQTGSTRVSFDLRVVPVSALAGGPAPEKMGDYPCSLMRFTDAGEAASGSGRPPADIL